MLAELRLKQFRSYTDDSFEFSPGVNIVVGPNASGKTNLLEAILTISVGSSYRAKDIDLIQLGSPWLRLDARLQGDALRTVKIVRDPPTRTYELDNKVFKRMTMNHTVPVVLFEPNHLLLISGSPEMRRSYLDTILEQTVAGYGALSRQYKRTLAQRNALLKREQSNISTQVFPWNIRLSQMAAQIVRTRVELVKQLQDTLPGVYTSLSHSNVKISVRYDAKCEIEAYETQMLKKLEANLELDQLRGYTSCGPHREDIIIQFDNHLASEVASRGETRTFILALKVFELQHMSKNRDITPLLLLDDVFSELDGARRHALTKYLTDYQTFITTTDADLVLGKFTKDCNIIALS